MFDPLELFRSVEVIWLIWLCSCLGLCGLTVLGLARVSWRRLWRQRHDERGAAYALSYVMVVPLYFMFVCLVVESSNILVTKVGTVYAAFAGARTAVVWQSAALPAAAEQRITQSAQQAFVGFASGIRVATDPAANPDSNQKRYLDTYENFFDDPAVSRNILTTKLANAQSRLQVTYQSATGWSDDVQVDVEYQFRFHVPVIGHALGTRGADGYRYFPIRSAVKLQNEGPQNETQRTGIRYASPN